MLMTEVRLPVRLWLIFAMEVVNSWEVAVQACRTSRADKRLIRYRRIQTR